MASLLPDARTKPPVAQGGDVHPASHQAAEEVPPFSHGRRQMRVLGQELGGGREPRARLYRRATSKNPLMRLGFRGGCGYSSAATARAVSYSLAVIRTTPAWKSALAFSDGSICDSTVSIGTGGSQSST